MVNDSCAPPVRGKSSPPQLDYSNFSFQTSVVKSIERDDPSALTADVFASTALEFAERKPARKTTPPRNKPQTYDPKALLNPKAVGKRCADDDSQNGVTSKTLEVTSMFERLHKIQRREDIGPALKKTESETANDAEMTKSSFTDHVASGTELGQYIKDLRKEDGPESQTTSSDEVVDLTKDADDEIIFMSDSRDKEVCLGRIEGASVNAYRVPAPKTGSWANDDVIWPPISISFRRLQHLRMRTVDAVNIDFGLLDPKTARALAPIMNTAMTSSVRLTAIIAERTRKGNEFPGSEASLSIPLDLTLYAPKSVAADIAKHLSKQSVWLRRPTKIDKKGVEYYNPQDVKIATPKYIHSTTITRPGYIARTVEEVRSDVLNMFDAIGHWENLQEQDSDDRIETPLLTHQKQALFFMNEREKLGEQQKDIEKSLWKSKQKANGQQFFYHVITGAETCTRPSPPRGGILADMMGLGKTLSVLSLIVGSLDDAAAFAARAPPRLPNKTQPTLVRNAKATLLVCPLSVVTNWEEQIAAHIRGDAISYHVYHGSNRIKNMKKLAQHDLVITSYGTLRTEFTTTRTQVKPIEKINWFRIVLDEAHQIRSASTTQSKAVCALSGERRWAVTGTPVQNRLDDLGALLKFLRIEPFDKTNQFQQHIIAPFKTGDTEILPKLRLLVDHITLRRLKDRIDLPARRDEIHRLDFSKEEEDVYDHFAKVAQKRANAYIRQRSTDKVAGKDYIQVLRLVTILRLLSAHGKDLLNEDDKRLLEGTSSSTAINLADDDENDDTDRPALSYNEAYNVLQDLRLNDSYECDRCKRSLGEVRNMDEDDRKMDTIGHMLPCCNIICPDCIDAFREEVASQLDKNRLRCPFCLHYVRFVFFTLKQSDIDRDEAARTRAKSNPRKQRMLNQYAGPHTKTKALVEALLRNQATSAESPDELPVKSVVFSAWTSHLDLIELALRDNNIAFTRLDGSMSRKKRGEALASFREEPEVTVILVSIYAGGLGLNLTSASKVYVMEPQFNPAAEAQAVDRVHRLGQTREVEVVKYIMNHSVEDRVLAIQRKKRALADLSMNRNLKLGEEEEKKRKLEELRDLFR